MKLEVAKIRTKIDAEYLNLRFTGDTALLRDSEAKLQIMVVELQRESLQVGLKMNMKKMKLMFNN